MNRNKTIFLVLAIFITSFILLNATFESTDTILESFRFPAEFEKQKSMWLAWSNEKYRLGKSTGSVVLNIIKEISPYVRVNLIVNNDVTMEKVKEYLKEKKINEKNISFHIISQYNRWLRDSGPIFVLSSSGKKYVVDFKFSYYGLLNRNDPESIAIDRVDRTIANKFKYEIIKTDLVSEGGNREFNGKGVMISVKSVELKRNPGKSIKYIEDEYKRIFGVKKIIWIEKGLITDDSYYNGAIIEDIYSSSITGGHIDEFCRFVSYDTILLAEVTSDEALKDPINRENYKRLENAYKILEDATDQDGNPFKIIRIPVAPNIIINNYEPTEEILKINLAPRGDDSYIPSPVRYVLASSYLNFLITDKVVLMPKYWKEERPEEFKLKDKIAKDTLQKAFPDRKIIQIDAEALNHGGGGIHCITQQEPLL